MRPKAKLADVYSHWDVAISWGDPESHFPPCNNHANPLISTEQASDLVTSMVWPQNDKNYSRAEILPWMFLMYTASLVNACDTCFVVCKSVSNRNGRSGVNQIYSCCETVICRCRFAAQTSELKGTDLIFLSFPLFSCTSVDMKEDPHVGKGKLEDRKITGSLNQ